MNFIADFHIHSHYSLATSKQLTPQYLDYWAKIKGVNVIGTGDFTHPKWTEELKNQLVQAEQGLFKLKQDFVLPNNPLADRQMRFILSAEISNIYKKKGKVRKVHNVVLAPDFETVDRIQKKLTDLKFNIRSDGRSILGLDSRDLLEILLEIDENIFFIPAHIWTPWFAALGSKSGFDTIEECYGDLTKYIFAVETGLSSDQPLNWLCSFLDKFSLLSNSDAHSPEKLGRNANIFNTEMSYLNITNALKNQSSAEFVGTIDMYPQEGKYHFDGHRKCNVCFSPTETMQNKGLCPVCGSKLTLGVAHRIAELADRDNPKERPIKKDFKYLIPLKEIIAEIKGVSPTSKSIDNIYFQTINDLGSEFDILFNIDTEQIKKTAGEFLAVAIERMRNNEVILKEGYDGEYGVIKLFEPQEIKNYGSKKSLFDTKGEISTERKKTDRKLLNFDVTEFRRLKNEFGSVSNIESDKKISQSNNEQLFAIQTESKHTVVVAGPGTGKTKVLIERIKFLIEQKKIEPDKIWAVTFSNQAANELKTRVSNLTDNEIAHKIKISTFHAFGYEILSKNNTFAIINDTEKQEILNILNQNFNSVKKIINDISFLKNTLNFENIDSEILNVFNLYNDYLKENNLIDFDDLIYLIIKDLDNKTPNFEHILIDEFQDINNAQYQIISKVASDDTSIFAIGDPNQSIYAFRGSDVNLIDKFINDYNAETYTLSKSYRCSDNILSASQNIVQSSNKIVGIVKGVKINISEQPTDKTEAEMIARTIEDMIGGLRFFSMDSNISKGSENEEITSLSDFAVLVRTKSQFEVLTKALNDHSIPFQIVGTKSFVSEKPFGEIITILKSIAFPDNKFYKILSQKINSKNKKIDLNLTLTELISSVWDNLFDNLQKISDFDLFLSLAKNCTITEFLAKIEQRSGQDDYNPNIEAVKLMTLHASKGLEFQCVFIPAIEQGIMPYTIFQKQVNIDEERRLLYVGMTRAKKYLFLSHSKSRKLKNMNLTLKKSEFLDNIKRELLQYNKQVFKSKPKDTQLDLFNL